MRLHAEYDPPRGGRVYEMLAEVRAEVAVVRASPDWNRYPHSFAHIFAGGYAAGYYSYKWAEVLAADAFAAFRERGRVRPRRPRGASSTAFSRGAAAATRSTAFVEFRGREPRIGPLLRSGRHRAHEPPARSSRCASPPGT